MPIDVEVDRLVTRLFVVLMPVDRPPMLLVAALSPVDTSISATRESGLHTFDRTTETTRSLHSYARASKVFGAGFTGSEFWRSLVRH
ncbi:MULTISPECIES: hypothetical protein [unclassified Variovorax]